MRFLILPLLALSLFPSAQKLTFDIFLFGDKVGQTIVEKIEKNDSITTYVLNSLSDAQVLFVHRKVALHYDEIFKRGQLISSYSKNVRNDETHTTTIEWKNNSYLMKRDDENFCLKPSVNCSTVKLFFAEPCDSKKIFSERTGEFREVTKTGEGVYEIEMPDDLTYVYHYTNGKLTELEMKKNLLGTIYLRPH